MAAVNEDLQRRLQTVGKTLRMVKIDPDSDLPPVAQLEKAIDTSPRPDALIVPNLDICLLHAGDKFLTALNFSRETITALGLPILFWASKNTLHQLGNRAADLFSQRAINTVFFGGKAEGAPSPFLFERFDQDRLNDAGLHALQPRIDLLEKQLAEAEAAAYPPTRIARDIALPLAEAYAGVSAFEAALQVLGRYQAHLPETADRYLLLGQIYFQAGDNAAAMEAYERALVFAKEMADKVKEWQVNLTLAEVLYRQGKYEAARDQCEKALGITRKTGDKLGEGIALNNLGQIYSKIGEYKTAIHYLEGGLNMIREIGDKSGEGRILNNLSQVYDARGDFDTAHQYLEQSLRIQREIGDKSGEGTTLNNLATILHAMDDHKTAFSYLEQSLRIRREIGDISGLAITLNNMAKILFEERNNPDEALPLFLESQSLFKQIGSPNEKVSAGHLDAIRQQIGEARYQEILTTVQGA